MSPTNDVMARILIPTIACLSCIVVAFSAVNAIAAMAQIRPHIGDIVTFTVAADHVTDDATRLIVHRPGQFGCILDLSVLRHSGGSFVIESQVSEATGSFRVHWAGPRTSADTANCGGDTDLILDGQELDILAFSAGGYGAGSKRMPIFVNQTGAEHVAG
jgi:hypothetical protein